MLLVVRYLTCHGQSDRRLVAMIDSKRDRCARRVDFDGQVMVAPVDAVVAADSIDWWSCDGQSCADRHLMFAVAVSVDAAAFGSLARRANVACFRDSARHIAVADIDCCHGQHLVCDFPDRMLTARPADVGRPALAEMRIGLVVADRWAEPADRSRMCCMLSM